MSVTLHGWRHSLYTQAAKVALTEKGVDFASVEVDPFGDPQAALAAGRPFARVPVLDHDGFRLYETQAIAAYVDAAFPGPALTPVAPRARARMVQAIALFDAYGFDPMIAQHYGHTVFAPERGEPADALSPEGAAMLVPCPALNARRQVPEARDSLRRFCALPQ